MATMFTSFSRRRSSSSSTSSGAGSLSLSPVGWNPSRPTISPPSITNGASSESSDSDSDFSRPTSSSSTTTPTKRRSLAPRSLSPPPSSFTTTSASGRHRTCAFPSWPTRDSLSPSINSPSPTSSCFSSTSALPSSRISDDDLMGLDFSRPAPETEEEAATALGISWSAVGTGAVAPPQVQPTERRRRLPPPPAQYRRRNSSRVPSRKNTAKKLGAITE